MDSGNPSPHRANSRIECTSTSVIVTEPDSVPECIEPHTTHPMQIEGEDLTDIKEVSLHFEEQWGKSGW